MVPSETSINSQTVPDLKQVLALPIQQKPLFPGIYAPIRVQDVDTIESIKSLQRQGTPYVGVFLHNPDTSSSENSPFSSSGIVERALTSTNEIHSVGALAQFQVAPTNTTIEGKDETKCKAIAGCIYTKPAGVAGGSCYPNTDSLLATATGKGATALQLAHVKQSMHNENVCGPIAKDEATCNADLRCAYNKAVKTCKASIFYLVHTLDSGGCTTEAAAMAKLYDTDVATANAISTSGAAGFSSLAVVVSALVAALSLIA